MRVPPNTIDVAALSGPLVDAVQAVEGEQGRAMVVRDGDPVAVLMSVVELRRLEPVEPGHDGSDPLLSLAGTCRHDAFVDGLTDLATTRLFSSSPVTDR